VSGVDLEGIGGSLCATCAQESGKNVASPSASYGTFGIDKVVAAKLPFRGGVCRGWSELLSDAEQ
jgi:hypothetical protein